MKKNISLNFIQINIFFKYRKTLLFFLMIFCGIEIKANDISEEYNLELVKEKFIQSSKVTNIYFKNKLIATNKLVSFINILNELTVIDSNDIIEIISKDTIIKIGLIDIISAKNKPTAYVVFDKVNSKLSKKDTISLSDINGKVNVKELEELFFSEATQKIHLALSKLNKNEINNFFTNISIIFIQDLNSNRWIVNPAKIRIIKK